MAVLVLDQLGKIFFFSRILRGLEGFKRILDRTLSVNYQLPYYQKNGNVVIFLLPDNKLVVIRYFGQLINDYLAIKVLVRLCGNHHF